MNSEDTRSDCETGESTDLRTSLSEMECAAKRMRKVFGTAIVGEFSTRSSPNGVHMGYQWYVAVKGD